MSALDAIIADLQEIVGRHIHSAHVLGGDFGQTRAATAAIITALSHLSVTQGEEFAAKIVKLHSDTMERTLQENRGKEGPRLRVVPQDQAE